MIRPSIRSLNYGSAVRLACQGKGWSLSTRKQTYYAILWSGLRCLLDGGQRLR